METTLQRHIEEVLRSIKVHQVESFYSLLIQQVLVSQIGFRQSLVDRILRFIIDEILTTNDAIEDGININSVLASKLNAILSVIFTSKQEEILFE
jgi:hypothetical protein